MSQCKVNHSQKLKSAKCIFRGVWFKRSCEISKVQFKIHTTLVLKIGWIMIPKNYDTLSISEAVPCAYAWHTKTIQEKPWIRSVNHVFIWLILSLTAMVFLSRLSSGHWLHYVVITRKHLPRIWPSVRGTTRHGRKQTVEQTMCIPMTSWWTRCCLKSPASGLFAQPFIQAQINENIKAPHHWLLCGEFTGDRWFSRTKGQ